VQKGSRTRHRR